MSFKWNPLTGNLDLTPANVLSAKTLVLTKIADENIGALKLVRLSPPTNCLLADNSSEINGTVIGITLNGAPMGGVVRILVFGIVEDPFFTFTINDRLFLGSNGEITNVQPGSGVLTGIGIGLGSGAIHISIEKPTIL